MNACARAAGPDNTKATATAAAIIFEIIRSVLPKKFGPEIGRTGARGQPIRSVKTKGCAKMLR
jgi:hypothetical protein